MTPHDTSGYSPDVRNSSRLRRLANAADVSSCMAFLSIADALNRGRQGSADGHPERTSARTRCDQAILINHSIRHSLTLSPRPEGLPDRAKTGRRAELRRSTNTTNEPTSARFRNPYPQARVSEVQVPPARPHACCGTACYGNRDRPRPTRSRRLGTMPIRL